MADNVAITAGVGTTIACDEVVDGTLGTVKVQYVKIMDATLDGTTKAAVGAAGLKVDGSGATQPVSGTVAATQSGTWTVQPGNTANTTPWLAKLHDGTNAVAVKAASTVPLASDPALVVALSPNGQNANGSALSANSAPVVIASDQSAIYMKERFFDVAATTITRPANTTQYAVGDSISNNGTAGSVTAISATVSDTNDGTILISEVIVDTNDTGIGAATTTLQAYLYDSDPTASSGVGGGDNAAFSNKRAGLIGTLSGAFVAMSDGGKARLIPDVGSYIIAVPTSGAKTIFVQLKITAGTPTPSANSTTLICNIRGIQGRA